MDLNKLKKVIIDLGSISIPVSLMEQVTIPLKNSIAELCEIYNGLVDEINKAKEAASAPELVKEETKDGEQSERIPAVEE